MASPSTKALLPAGAVLIALVAVAAGAGGAAAALTVPMVGAAAFVAFAAQSGRLRDQERLVYRPVYARRRMVQRRLSSED